MMHGAIGAARVGRDEHGVPMSLDHGDIYHPRAGAFVQARHVFLGGNGLPDRWRGRDRFVVLETGFGLGNNFLATWAAWQADPQRCARLVFISVEQHPLHRADLAAMHRDSPLPALAAALVSAWPPATPDLHHLSFDDGRVTLLLALGEISAWMPLLQAEVDACYLDGFAPARNPSAWEPRLFQALARLAAPGATAATWTAARMVREGLAGAGFSVRLGAGTGGKRDITLARFEPRFVPKRPPARCAAPPEALAERHAVVVGAGLAGCATVAALAAQGWRTTLIDRADRPAAGASGNPAGLFHGVVHGEEGPHARFHRACALRAARVIDELLPTSTPHGPAGAVDGLLRLETGLDLDAMRRLLARLGLPDDHVQALDATAASELAGLSLASPAWWHHAGGWVRPAWLCERWREAAGDACRFIGGGTVTQLRRGAHGWDLLDAAGATEASAPVVVLANAWGSKALLETLGMPAAACPMTRVRGQISLIEPGLGLALPEVRRPVVGSGYLLPRVDGRVVFGATAQADDPDPSVRDDDHRQNLARLAQLGPSLADLARLPADRLQGRTGFRCVSRDRLPLVGAVPQAWVGGPDGDWDQPRFVPRAPGLYLCAALGSRGITMAPLAAELLAATITGAPLPLPSDLVDAVDPARFVARATRRRVAGRPVA